VVSDPFDTQTARYLTNLNLKTKEDIL